MDIKRGFIIDESDDAVREWLVKSIKGINPWSNTAEDVVSSVEGPAKFDYIE